MQKDTIYKIATAYEGVETGATPQVAFEKRLIDDQLLKRLRIMKFEGISALSESLPNLLVYEGSNLTDHLSIMDISMARGRLISSELYHVLKKLSSTNVNSIKFNVIDKEEKHQYYYTDISGKEVEEFIDFKNSLFKVIPGGRKIQLNNVNEFEKELKKLFASYLTWHRLLLRSEVFEKFDIFRLKFGNSNWYGNTKAKEVLGRFSGLRIEEAKNVVLI